MTRPSHAVESGSCVPGPERPGNLPGTPDNATTPNDLRNRFPATRSYVMTLAQDARVFMR
jgi:hypothetical protein